MTGTVIDCFGIILGGAIGTILKNKLIKKDLADKVLQMLGLCALLVGITGVMDVSHPLVAIISIVSGGIIGTLLHIESKLETSMNRLSSLMKKTPVSTNFIEGFTSYSLLSIVGSMAIVGAIENSLNHNISTLLTKTTLDFICAVLFGSTFGVCICFTSVVVLLYQGIFSWLASILSPLITAGILGDMSAIGSVLIIVVGFNLLNITDYKTMDLVPAIFLPVILCQFI